MLRYVAGLILPFLGIIVWQGYEWYEYYSSYPVNFLRGHIAPAISFAAACVISTTIAIFWNYRRPRRMFDRRTRSRISPVVAGLITSLLTLLIAIPAVVFLDKYAADFVLLTASAPLPTLLVLRLARPLVPGECARCRFDLRASLAAGRCPECGTSILPG